MKHFIIPVIMTLFMASCSMDNDIPELEIPIKSELTAYDFQEIGFELKSKVYEYGDTRSEDTLEELVKDPEVIKIFNPLVEDGLIIVQQINAQQDHLSQEDQNFYNTLSDDQLALLSIVAVAYGCVEEDTSLHTRSIDMQRVRTCLVFALGVSQIKNLTVKGLVSATTLRSALWTIGKRYVGYLGVALMVWDFYDCFN